VPFSEFTEEIKLAGLERLLPQQLDALALRRIVVPCSRAGEFDSPVPRLHHCPVPIMAEPPPGWLCSTKCRAMTFLR